MRKILGSFVCAILLSLCGCNGNPIASVNIAANVLGGFDVNIVFTNGQTMSFPNVSPGTLAVMQKRYHISSTIIHRTDAPICQAVDVSGIAYESVTPSIPQRLRNLATFHSSCYVTPTPNATVIPAPDDWPHYELPAPQTQTTFTAPQSASTISLEARVAALESKMDRVLAIAEKLNK